MLMGAITPRRGRQPRVGIAASGGTVLPRHILQKEIPWLIAAHRSGVAYHRPDEVLGFKGIGDA
jgi:hypothetical protein